LGLSADRSTSRAESARSLADRRQGRTRVPEVEGVVNGLSDRKYDREKTSERDAEICDEDIALTVDKLGVKLYDRVSAVIAELVANSYDADATKVTISLRWANISPAASKTQSKDRGFRHR